MDPQRRRFLKLGSIVAAGGLAGCSTETESTPADPTQGDGGTETPAGTPTAAQTPAGGDGGGDGDGGGGGDGTAEFDFGGWFSDTSNYDGAVTDLRGESSVTVEVGTSANGGAFGFGPPAVWVDPGTEVTWEWTGNGGAHNVVAQSGADFRSGDATSDADTTFSQTFESAGVVTYFCEPHRGLGMKGAVVVGEPEGASTATPAQSGYGFQAASMDAYWYSLYNMSTNIAMSGNGIIFPATDQQQQVFQERFPEMLAAANQPGPPVKNPNLNMAPFTEGDPHFTEQPVLEGEDGRPDASTLQWDKSKSSMTVSPSSLAWTHLKGVTWAKNFENHFDILPDSLAAEFRSMVLSTLAQVGTVFALVSEQGGGNFRLNDENLLLASAFRPGEGVVDDTPRPSHHSAMLWFLSNLNSLAQGGWFGYENPEPLIPPENVQMLTNGMGKTTMNAVSPGDVSNTRLAGELLGAVGWFGTQTNQDQLRQGATEYANGLAGVVEDNLAGNGMVENGADNQAATQGMVAQGLLWASQIDGVDHTDTAGDVIGYMTDELWDGDAGTFKSGADDDVYTITARDAGDITGGLNAADAVLGRSEAQEQFAQFFNQTFNRGRLQRAERPPSRDENAEFTLPLPPAAGGEFGQAAVYNGEVEYDAGADEWSVTDDRFYTAEALYLANQDIWVGNWAGDFYQGRGVPGQNDTPE